MDTLGERIFYLLEKNNMTKAQLAKEIKKSKPMITNYINNDSEPTVTVLKDIANALHVDINYLVFGIEDLLEKQLIDLFRQLDNENKANAIGELTKLLTIQDIKK